MRRVVHGIEGSAGIRIMTTRITRSLTIWRRSTWPSDARPEGIRRWPSIDILRTVRAFYVGLLDGLLGAGMMKLIVSQWIIPENSLCLAPVSLFACLFLWDALCMWFIVKLEELDFGKIPSWSKGQRGKDGFVQNANNLPTLGFSCNANTGLINPPPPGR
jgi:hypothetical protein